MEADQGLVPLRSCDDPTTSVRQHLHRDNPTEQEIGCRELRSVGPVLDSASKMTPLGPTVTDRSITA